MTLARVRRCGAALAMGAVVIAVGCGGATRTVTAGAGSGLIPLKAYRVPAVSMEPTISAGEDVFAEAPFAAPHVGDIVVFHPPTDAQETSGGGVAKCGPIPHVVADGSAACDQPVSVEARVHFVKRIVAGPGDVISIVEGHVIRNGRREADSYIKPCITGDPICNFPTPIRIPSGDWFTLGDNRGESDDSRFWGPIPLSWIVAVVRSCSQLGRTCAGT